MKKLCTAGLLTGVLLLGSVGGAFADSRADELSKELGTNVKIVKLSDLTQDAISKLKMNIVKGDIVKINLADINDEDMKKLEFTGADKAKFEQDFKDGKISIAVDENSVAKVEYIGDSNK